MKNKERYTFFRRKEKEDIFQTTRISSNVTTFFLLQKLAQSILFYLALVYFGCVRNIKYVQ